MILLIPLAIFVLILILCRVLLVAPEPLRADKGAALSFDLSPAREAHRRRTGTSETETSRLDREFRRWFVVAAASPLLIGMGSKAVDEYWHTLLAVEEGQLYARFSQAVANRHVAHVEGVGSDDLNARAWVGYEAIWGSAPPADLFPKPPEEALARHRAKASDSSGGGGGEGGDRDTVSLSFDSSGDGGGGDGGGGDGGGCGGGGK